MSRISWDEYFLDIAEVVASRSTCPRASVGVVLVRDRRILATGYNGAAPGKPHCEEVGCNVEHDHCTRAIHAEQNAIGQAGQMGFSVRGSTAYIYTSKHVGPCGPCAHLMEATGVAGHLTRTQPRRPTMLDLQREIYDWAKRKGWWEGERNFGELIALAHTELSEALEEWRHGHPITEVRIEQGKPEGVPVEFADVVIRILDTAEAYGFDLGAVIRQKMTYNETRSYRHGGKLA